MVIVLLLVAGIKHSGFGRDVKQQYFKSWKTIEKTLLSGILANFNKIQ